MYNYVWKNSLEKIDILGQVAEAKKWSSQKPAQGIVTTYDGI